MQLHELLPKPKPRKPKATRKLASAFVRKGTHRMVRICNDDKHDIVSHVFIRYQENGNLDVQVKHTDRIAVPPTSMLRKWKLLFSEYLDVLRGN